MHPRRILHPLALYSLIHSAHKVVSLPLNTNGSVQHISTSLSNSTQVEPSASNSSTEQDTAAQERDAVHTRGIIITIVALFAVPSILYLIYRYCIRKDDKAPATMTTTQQPQPTTSRSPPPPVIPKLRLHNGTTDGWESLRYGNVPAGTPPVTSPTSLESLVRSASSSTLGAGSRSSSGGESSKDAAAAGSSHVIGTKDERKRTGKFMEEFDYREGDGSEFEEIDLSDPHNKKHGRVHALFSKMHRKNLKGVERK